MKGEQQAGCAYCAGDAEIQQVLPHGALVWLCLTCVAWLYFGEFYGGFGT